MAQPMMRIFAPAGDAIYVIGTSLKEPALVVDRREPGACRIVPPSEMDSVIGPANARAKSIRIFGVVGLFSYPDDHSLVVVTEVATRSVASEHGATSVSAIAKVVFLPLRAPAPAAGASESTSGSTASASDVDAAGGTFAERAALAAKQRTHLKELLEAGDCYVCDAASAELTHTLQRRARRADHGASAHAGAAGATASSATFASMAALSLASADERFVWNRAALAPLAEVGPGPWLTVVMQAAIFTEQLAMPAGGVLTVSLVSRRSCEHPGTRFKTRGLNDEGGAANSVRTRSRRY